MCYRCTLKCTDVFKHSVCDKVRLCKDTTRLPAALINQRNEEVLPAISHPAESHQRFSVDYSRHKERWVYEAVIIKDGG